MATLVAFALIGACIDASAARGGGSRPPPKTSYKPISPHVPDGVRPGVADPIRQAPVERPAADVRQHWDVVTQSLGAETHTSDGSYVVVHAGRDGNAWMTTNLVRGTDSDRTFTALSPAELGDAVRLETRLQRMLGDHDPGATVTLKVLLEGSLADDATRTEAIKLLGMATKRFRFAELVEVSTGRASALELVDLEIGQSHWLGRLNTCCAYDGIPPDVASWRNLASVPFNRSTMQVVSLFPDYTAQQRLKGSGLNIAITHPENINGDVGQALKQVFASGAPGSPVIVIGHVKNGDFVIETGNGTAISLATVSDMAGQAGRPVYLMGCYTAEHYLLQPPQSRPSLGFPISTLSVLHPRELVDRLVAASLNSKSLQDFTQLMSNESLYVYLPSKFLTTLPDQRRSLRARIVSVTQGGVRAVTAFFRVDLPCLFGHCP